MLNKEYRYTDNCFKQARFERQASNTFTNSEGINKSLGVFVELNIKCVWNHWNEHSQNRSQKQLTETPDPQFNRGFQYTVPFDRFHTTLSIVYHVEMLEIQCF